MSRNNVSSQENSSTNAGLKAITYICGVIASLCVIVSGLLVSVEVNIGDSAFFAEEYKKCRVDADLGMEMKDVEYVSKEMMKYLFGQREDLVVYTNLRGEYREFFNDREKTHMIDVKNLYDGAVMVRTVCLVSAVVLVGIIVFLHRKKALDYLSRSYLFTCIAAVVFFGGILIFISSYGFTEFWFKFHGVFFTNDLWLLNPATDMMILLLPEQFFFDLVFRSLLYFGIITGLLIILSIVRVSIVHRNRHAEKA